MFVVRFIALAFLTAYSWSMGQIPTNELNAFGTFISFLFFFAAPALYLLPTFEAWLRKHPNLAAIALVNVFLGWSLIGWVIAAVWAFKKPELVVALASAMPAAPEPLAQDTKKCPFCAENILAEAIKCKHCGSALPAA